MNRFGNLIWNSRLQAILLLSQLIFLAVHVLPFQYSNYDTLIYAIIGKAIYRDGIMPYDYIFDHKPFLIYFFYGPLGLLESKINVFALFSVFWLLAISIVIYTILFKKRVPFLLILVLSICATFGTVSFSGNSEVVFVTLELLAIGLAFHSMDRPFLFILSAVTAVAAVNINYVSGPPLLFTLLYCLYISSRSISRFYYRSVVYLITCLIILFIVLGVLYFSGLDVINYLSLQRDFLLGYSGERLAVSTSFLIILLLPSFSVLLVFFPNLFSSVEHRSLHMTMSILIISSVISFFLSAKFYNHYAFMVTAPAVVSFLTINYSRLWLRVTLTFSLILASFTYLCLSAYFYLNSQYSLDLWEFYRPLKEAVEDQPIMSMHASIVPLYFSGAEPFQPLAWFDHAEIIYGAGADDFYADLLKKFPSFVMTSEEWCEKQKQDRAACDALSAHYIQVQSRQTDWPAHGYSLYRLNH